jgi:hypothetical protein
MFIRLTLARYTLFSSARQRAFCAALLTGRKNGVEERERNEEEKASERELNEIEIA